MADIDQSNQYERLIRRIGYSVGLEDIVERIGKLVDLYVRERNLNLALWKNLVKEEYGRKISDDLEAIKWGGNRKTKKKLGAEDHFADFYSELNLIYHQSNQIFPLYGIEILSILRRFFSDDSLYEDAMKSVLLLFILEADGDIFLNCLFGNFEKESVKEAIISMFKAKKQAYFKAYINPYSRNKLSLQFKVQTTSNQDDVFKRKINRADEIDIPDDYLSKILPSRKGWAMQLGLYSNKLELRGEKLIIFLQSVNIIHNNYAAFYCYTETHKALFIDERKIGTTPFERKVFQKIYFENYFEVRDSDTSRNESDTSRVYELLFKIMELYKSGNRIKGVIRHQLPFHILFPVFYVISALTNLEFYDLSKFIDEEQKSPSRKLDILHLRGNETEGALSFRI